MLRDRNTMNETAFYLCCIIFTIFFLYLYVNAFKIPDGANYVVVFVIEMASFIVGINMFSKRRNLYSALVIGACPSLFFYILAYFYDATLRILIALSVGMFLSITYACLQHYKGKASRKCKRRHIRLGTISILTICLATALMLPIGEYHALEQYQQKHNEKYEFSGYDEETDSLDANIEELSKLDDSIWPTLSKADKRSTIELLSVLEAKYLLGASAPTIVYRDDMNENTLGSANHNEYRIELNSDVLSEESSYNAVFTLEHEMFHLYEGKCVDLLSNLSAEDHGLLMIKLVDTWSQDFSHYVSGEDESDYGQYKSQSCEVAANEYADNSCKQLFKKITEHLNANEQ